MSRLRRSVWLSAILIAAAQPASAESVAEFYSGRPINVLIGNSPGGGVDTYARMLARHIGKHIPGKPTLVAQNMAGGGGVKAVNYLYNAAPQDGTYIAIMLPSTALEPSFGNKAAKYDTFKLHWIGNMARDASSCVVMQSSPIKTFSDLFQKEGSFGGSGPGATTAQYAYLLHNVLNAKVKVITGYGGTRDIALAMERGELDGMCSFWSSLALGAQAEDITSGKYRVIVQMGTKPTPVFGNAPMVFDFAKNKEDRDVLEFVYGQTEVTRPFAAPPGLSAERVAALQTAFTATMNDPEFKSDAARAKLLIDPMDGKQTEEAFRKMLSAPPALIERAVRMIRK